MWLVGALSGEEVGCQAPVGRGNPTAKHSSKQTGISTTKLLRSMPLATLTTGERQCS